MIHDRRRRHRRFPLTLVLALLAAPVARAAAQEARAANGPLRVFVLAGQSNMQGHAHVRTLDAMALDPATAPILEQLVDADGTPRVCDDVWISSIGSAEQERIGRLTVGFGADARGPKIGPELTFGVTMRELLDGPILIVKTAWGGKSLNTDFRPPSAGPYVFDETQLAAFEQQGKDVDAMRAEKAAATGVYYRLMIEHVRTVLADLSRVVPEYDAARGYELAGFVWFQGWNDMVDRGAYPKRDKPGGYDAYSEVLAHFIRDVREDLSAPELPFAIGVLGVGGPVDRYGPDQQRYAGVHQNFRDAMAAPASLTEFAGTVTAVLTEDCWDMEVTALRGRERELQPELKRIGEAREAGTLSPEEARAARDELRAKAFTARELRLLDESTSNAEFHYLGSARILTRIGKAFAEALFEILPDGGVARAEDEVTRVFLFAGQSNMVGSDSRVADIERFPPFRGLETPREDVRFSYVLGREVKTRSDGWVALQPVNGIVGPELSFARAVRSRIDAPIAIVKCAAGGTHLGGDWNPDEPSGFEMYPLLLETVRSSLAALDEQGVRHRLEGLMWHQGENDMFDEEYMANYGANLANFLRCLRRDLAAPELRVYVGELCTKTIWGMDLRPRMDAIARGQKAATAADPLAQYVRTSHVGVEIGGGVGLHYHYGTLGQLEHGVNYAEAYLANLGLADEPRAPLETWPHPEGSEVELYVLAGHRNMEGERAFVQRLVELEGGERLAQPNDEVPFRYSLGGGVKISSGWEPLAPAGLYDTFGPELAFGATLARSSSAPIAIAKFTHSGSQIIDWTPAGSEAEDRNLYPSFLEFVRESIADLEARGHRVKLGGVVYHVGENDMSFQPYRREAPERLAELVRQSREDLGLPELTWFLSQQPPTDHESVNGIDVTAGIAALAAADEHCVHLKAFDLPPQEKQLVIDTAGIVRLGEWLAEQVLARK